MFQKICKRITIVVVALVGLVVLAEILSLIISGVADDIACSRYKKQVLSGLELPSGTEIVEVVSGCGNTSGTGNHTELCVSVLIKTTLQEEEWNAEDFLKTYDASGCYDVENDGQDTFAMQSVGLSFTEIEENPEEKLYILEYIKDAPCSLYDLRGH